jgi:uncharacterized protein (DUF362 family)
MNKNLVAIVKYENPLDSVRKAVELSHGLDHLPSGAKVFIKPNIVFWTKATNFPKYGVITTSRVVEDMVVLLKERGINDIRIGDGTVLRDPKDMETQLHAYKALGYGELEKRYGVKHVNIWERPFEKVDLGDGVELKFNSDILASDFVVDLPVMKTHSMTVVSLGIKNLKGMIDIPSRKKCHNTHPEKDLHFWVSRLADKMPPIFTLIDGIYTAEQGPNIDGRMHRSNLLVASADVLSADMVAAKVLGYEPDEISHLVHAAQKNNRNINLSEIEIVGESLESVAKPHKYDLSLCTYCSGMTSTILAAIAKAWQGQPWDDVEILSGKVMKPEGGKKKTILFGKCMYQANKDNPDINEMIAIKGCPPKPENIYQALQRSGIAVDRSIFENMEMIPGKFLKRYKDRPEFDESFFTIC